MGGETYLRFTPDLIDGSNAIADEAVRAFLQSFLDQFAALLARLATSAQAAA